MPSFIPGAGVLAIFSAEAQEKYIPGAAEPANNRSAILEFRVANVDAEYVRLQSLVQDLGQGSHESALGNMFGVLSRPDGNLVDFYSPAKINRVGATGESGMDLRRLRAPEPKAPAGRPGLGFL